MTATAFIPEIWAAQLLSSLNKSLVFAGPGVANRNYEGSIAAAGDTVNITSVSAPAITAYVKGTDITVGDLANTSQVLTVTEQDYFAFAIDSIDYRQSVSGGALMAEAAREAAFGLADAADVYMAGVVDAGTASANQKAATHVATAAEAVSELIALKVVLDESNTPSQGRYVIVPSWFHALLLASPSFVDASQSGSTEALRNGAVGRAFGFDVIVSQNTVSSDSGDDNVVQAGYPGATTFVQNIASVEAYRPESSFSDALKGLSVYGAKVLRDTNLASVIASQSAV
jgi:hypothetical protein